MIVWLVVSSYRNDKDILRILDQVYSYNIRPFARILIIDSQGTGVIPAFIRDKGWTDVIYRSYDHNLGSGANLRERLRIAAEGSADYAYAVNHDAYVSLEIVNALLAAARSIKFLGAAYPLSYLMSIGRYNLTGTRELPLSRKLVLSVNHAQIIDVFWSSSNGALYSLEPTKCNILPWEAMWMAWEDLEYGWRLHDHGYRQVIVCNAVFHDNNEYVNSRIGHVTDKPPWRTYYFTRNLILAIKRSRNRPIFHMVAAYRFVLEATLIFFVRSNKWQRFRFLWKGIWHGLQGFGGQGRIP